VDRRNQLNFLQLRQVASNCRAALRYCRRAGLGPV